VSGLWEAVVQDIVESPDPRKPKNFWTEHEMLQNTFFFNLMGRDEARGLFELDGFNRLTLRFEGGPLVNDPVYQKMEEIIQAMVAKMGGQYVRFPFWGRRGLLPNEPNPERKFVTVHPLGGCVMGNSSSDGVVDAKGGVFNTPAGGQSVHHGLYVADAAVVPGPVAVNPTLTIVALAQKISSQIP
jgi:cholesterol oxidase